MPVSSDQQLKCKIVKCELKSQMSNDPMGTEKSVTDRAKMTDSVPNASSDVIQAKEGTAPCCMEKVAPGTAQPKKAF